MTNSGFRCLILAAVAAAGASLSALSDAHADETGRAGSPSEKTPAIQIVPGVSQASEVVDVVIAPACQALAGKAAEEDDAPILVAPQEEKQPAKAKAEKKPAKPSAKSKPVAKPVAKKRASAEAKSAPKKPAAAPMAKETASEKARAEWQKKRSGHDDESAASKSRKRAADEARDSAAAEKKRATMARFAAKFADSTVANTPEPAKPGRVANVAKDSRSYREIYNSIPFSRSEYDANPAYRHQATMEIMLGQLHPIIVAPPSLPRQATRHEITIRYLPSIRPGYRPYSQYPWH
jgi:outer membrane biosynthesis protein TonB